MQDSSECQFRRAGGGREPMAPPGAGGTKRPSSARIIAGSSLSVASSASVFASSRKAVTSTSPSVPPLIVRA